MTAIARKPVESVTYRYQVEPFDWSAPAPPDRAQWWTLRVHELRVTIGDHRHPDTAHITLRGDWIRDGEPIRRPRRHEMNFHENLPDWSTHLTLEHAPATLLPLIEKLRALTACTRRDTTPTC
ncbi:hypothetical protein [Leifsonia aquatica]|uniref:hypothetical protein n=1 Tax=Leifsonia aquatica TaxID=144185 RepID=UPI00380562A9